MIVRQPPYRQRSARAQLDVVLAAAVLEYPLELYFLGEGIWQLAVERESEAAALPRGLKGWAALPGMTSVRFFADEGACGRLREWGIGTAVPAECLALTAMAERWAACSQVMAL